MIDLVYCAGGNARFAEIALRYGFRYGAQMPLSHHNGLNP